MPNTTVNGGKHVTAQVQNMEHMQLEAGVSANPSLEAEPDEELQKNDASVITITETNKSGMKQKRNMMFDSAECIWKVVDPKGQKVRHDAEHVAPQGLAKALIAYNNNELSLEDLRRAFETAKSNDLDPNDPVYKSVKLLISSMEQEFEEFSIEGENDEDLITFKIWDQGGQTVR